MSNEEFNLLRTINHLKNELKNGIALKLNA